VDFGEAFFGPTNGIFVELLDIEWYSGPSGGPKNAERQRTTLAMPRLCERSGEPTVATEARPKQGGGAFSHRRTRPARFPCAQGSFATAAPWAATVTPEW
jgi:hypothetical protein